jgi:hypothetical protein
LTKHADPVNRYEYVELNALLYYVAHQTSKTEDGLRREVLGLLGLPDFDGLSVYDYRRASDYLKSSVR